MPYPLLSIFQLLSLIPPVAFLGSVLSLFTAAPWVWGMTGSVMVYLLWVGRGGLLLASLWVTLLMTALIAFDLFPKIWPQNLHYRYWALSLMTLWGMAIAILYLLSSYGDMWRRNHNGLQRWGQQSLGVAGVVMGLALGHSVSTVWLIAS
ncbi:MAG: hypothetical protein ACFBSG_14940 [Leptolyngbyaceae cyanobacterium]